MGLKVGDKVCYSRQFLRATGQVTGLAPFREGTITWLSVPELFPQKAKVKWFDTAEEQMVLCMNLTAVDQKHLEPV